MIQFKRIVIFVLLVFVVSFSSRSSAENPFIKNIQVMREKKGFDKAHQVLLRRLKFELSKKETDGPFIEELLNCSAEMAVATKSTQSVSAAEQDVFNLLKANSASSWSGVTSWMYKMSQFYQDKSLRKNFQQIHWRLENLLLSALSSPQATPQKANAALIPIGNAVLEFRVTEEYISENFDKLLGNDLFAKNETTSPSDYFDGLFLRSEGYRLEGKYQDAINVLKPFPIDGNEASQNQKCVYSTKIANLHLNLGDADTAENLLDTVLNKIPEGTDREQCAQSQAIIRAFILTKKGQFSKAEEIAGSLKKFMNESVAQNILASVFIYSGKGAEAVKLLEAPYLANKGRVWTIANLYVLKDRVIASVMSGNKAEYLRSSQELRALMQERRDNLRQEGLIAAWEVMGNHLLLKKPLNETALSSALKSATAALGEKYMDIELIKKFIAQTKAGH